MTTNPRGFTMLEMMVAIVLAGVLLSITIPAFGSVRARFAAEQGLQVFESLVARARAQAIETGVSTRLFIDVAADTASLSRGAVQLERVDFQAEFDVDVEGTTLVLCMSPRGFADSDCTSFTEPTTLLFKAASNTETVVVLPLGQLVK